MSGTQVWTLLRQTYSEWSEDKAPQLGASLAFYSALSIAPLLVIALSVASFILDEEAARGQVVTEFQRLVGSEGGEAIEDMINSAKRPGSGAVATVLSISTLLFGASGVFGQLQDALNTIWEVKPKLGRGILGFLQDRFLSFAAVLGVAFLLLVSLLLTTALAAAGLSSDALPEALRWLAQFVDFAVSFVVITVLFAIIFKLLPDVTMAWSDVWLGAAVTTALFSVGKFAIGVYLGNSSMASSYGVAGSFVVLLVWTYYSAQILFFGAELTQVYANSYGSRIVPTENAEPLKESDRENQNENWGRAAQEMLRYCVQVIC
jgi:membrane protein